MPELGSYYDDAKNLASLSEARRKIFRQGVCGPLNAPEALEVNDAKSLVLGIPITLQCI